jgi:hypothetical protein
VQRRPQGGADFFGEAARSMHGGYVTSELAR